MKSRFVFACRRCLKVTSTTNSKIADIGLCSMCRLDKLSGHAMAQPVPESIFGILKNRKIKYTQEEHEEATGD